METRPPATAAMLGLATRFKYAGTSSKTMKSLVTALFMSAPHFSEVTDPSCRDTEHCGHQVVLEIALDMARASPTSVVTTRSPEAMSQRFVFELTAVVEGSTRIAVSPFTRAKFI